jgi:hypothetical protein
MDIPKNPSWEIGSNKDYIQNNLLELKHRNRYHTFIIVGKIKGLRNNLL